MKLNNSYLGFTDGMKPMHKAKIENTLDKLIRSNGKITTEKQWTYDKLEAGYRPQVEEDYVYYKRNGELSKPKTLYKLQGDGNFYEVNKTLYSFAKHILDNNFLNDETVSAFMTAEQERIAEEERIKAEQEAKERAEREAQKEKEKQEREQKKVKRITDIQNIIMNFTEDELNKINKLTDFYITEKEKMNKGNILSQYNNDYPSIMSYYDIMTFLAKEKLYPEATINSIKHYRSTLDPDSDNPNRTNERYMQELKITNYIRNEFFGITDNMSYQTIRALLTGQITVDEAHNRVRKNEQRKEKEAEKIKTFYRQVGNKFVKEQGEQIRVNKYTVYGIVLDGKYTLIEERTGVALGKAKNKTAAIKTAQDNIEKMGIEKVDKIIQNVIDRYGLSPLLQNQTA